MYYAFMCRLLITCLLFLLIAPAARAADLVILVDTATEMPMARFERYRLVAGIHRDIGLELARRMHRTPKFMSLPRKRIVKALVDWLEANAPKSAYVSLIADGPAKDLYAQYGFRETAPESVGMYLRIM